MIEIKTKQAFGLPFFDLEFQLGCPVSRLFSTAAALLVSWFSSAGLREPDKELFPAIFLFKAAFAFQFSKAIAEIHLKTK